MKNWKPLALLNDLILMALGVALTAVAAGYQEPLIWLQKAFETAQNRIITGSVGLLLLVITFIVLIKTLSRSHKAQTFLVKTSNQGSVLISSEALLHMINTIAKEVPDVKEVTPQISAKGNGVIANLEIRADSDMNLPQLGAHIQDRIVNYLQDVAGLKVYAVNVQIKNMSTSGRKPFSPSFASEPKLSSNATSDQTDTAQPDHINSQGETADV